MAVPTSFQVRVQWYSKCHGTFVLPTREIARDTAKGSQVISFLGFSFKILQAPSPLEFKQTKSQGFPVQTTGFSFHFSHQYGTSLSNRFSHCGICTILAQNYSHNASFHTGESNNTIVMNHNEISSCCSGEATHSAVTHCEKRRQVPLLLDCTRISLSRDGAAG